MFTAVTFTRMLVVQWVRRARPQTMTILRRRDTMRLLKLVPDNTNIDFVRLRGWGVRTDSRAQPAGDRHHLRARAQFGRRLRRRADDRGEIPLDPVARQGPAASSTRRGVGEGALQLVGDNRTLSIRLPTQTGGEGATNAAVKKVEGAIGAAFPGATFSRYATISGKVSGELIRNGVLAVVLAVLGIGLFAIFRFEWQFGVSTVVAIVHDLLMTVGFFALTRFEFDLNIVAAVLTIIGYSINDKIVIDDRIRENMAPLSQDGTCATSSTCRSTRHCRAR